MISRCAHVLVVALASVHEVGGFVVPVSHQRAGQAIQPSSQPCQSATRPSQGRARSYDVWKMTETPGDTSSQRKEEVLSVLSDVIDPGERRSLQHCSFLGYGVVCVFVAWSISFWVRSSPPVLGCSVRDMTS